MCFARPRCSRPISGLIHRRSPFIRIRITRFLMWLIMLILQWSLHSFAPGSPGSIMKMNLLRSGISPLLYMLNIMLSVYSSFKIGLFGSLAYCNLGVLLTHLNLHSFTLRLSITGRWSLLQSEQKYVLHCKTWISH